MKCEYLPAFLRDYKKLRDKKVQAAIDSATDQAESAATLGDVPQLRRLEGAAGYYRIRVGDYRLGVFVRRDLVLFLRCGHRRDFYRTFP